MVGAQQKYLSGAVVAAVFPSGILDTLANVRTELSAGELYMTGGTVRDLLLARKPADIDLTVSDRARLWAGRLAALTGGTYVELGRDEDAARVVWQGLDIDFSSFREGAFSIDEELQKRDITVNSMALPVYGLLDDPTCIDCRPLPVLDPVGGIADLEQQLIRVTSRQSFVRDPLRLLRVFRFAAVLGFAVDPQTQEQVHLHRREIERVSRERVAHELDLIMVTPRAYPVFSRMRQCGLLWEVLPELRAGEGMQQPASHHLDVFEHCLEALRQMEEIVGDPGNFFPENREVMEKYLQVARRSIQLKWAALFHDIGKPVTYAINEDKGDRITFYEHDLQGAEIFSTIARRLRWSNDDTALVAHLIRGHMRPFFLANNERQGKLSLKACLRLVKAMGEHLPGLFLLAMADALAGKGEGSPEDMEQEISGLFMRLEQVERNHVTPVRTAPPLLTGKDLIEELHLRPGPLFRRILEQVEDAHMAHAIATRSQALALAAECARKYEPLMNH